MYANERKTFSSINVQNLIDMLGVYLRVIRNNFKRN